MEAPSPIYILNRALFFIALLVVFLFCFRFYKKYQRKSAIFTDLQSITSDSSFFQQFSEDDAKKSLVRAIGLIAEANELGVPPDKAIDRGMGIKQQYFENEMEKNDPPAREKIIRTCLRTNYENFIRFGYKGDFHTVDALKKGELPPIPSGVNSGRTPHIANLISPSISPGMEKVIANLELRPPLSEDQKPTDIQIAAAKQLARDLAAAQIIEEPVSVRILKALSTPPAP